MRKPSFLPPSTLRQVLVGRHQKMNQRSPVSEILRTGRRKPGPVRADCNWQMRLFRREVFADRSRNHHQIPQDRRWHRLLQPSQSCADRDLQCSLQLRANHLVEMFLRQLFAPQRNELRPLLSPLQHLCDQPLAINETAIAMQQQLRQRLSRALHHFLPTASAFVALPRDTEEPHPPLERAHHRCPRARAAIVQSRRIPNRSSATAAVVACPTVPTPAPDPFATLSQPRLDSCVQTPPRRFSGFLSAAASSSSRIRSRISCVAFLVNVIASTCSGSVTASCPSSLRYR